MRSTNLVLMALYEVYLLTVTVVEIVLVVVVVNKVDLVARPLDEE